MSAAAADPAGLRHSWWGIASLVLGVLNLLGALLSVALMIVIVGFILYMLVLASSLLGIALGVIGLLRRDRRRGLAITGIGLNMLATPPAVFYLLLL